MTPAQQPLPQHRFWAVIPAAGSGSRMNTDVPKQYLEVNGRKVIEHTLACLGRHQSIAGIMVAIGADDRYWPEVKTDLSVPVMTVTGGHERPVSVYHALLELQTMAASTDWVLVHDAARPCLRQHDLSQLIEQVSRQTGDGCGGLLGVPVRDTMKRVSNNYVVDTVDRDGLWHALTPQMFRLGELRQALESALSKNLWVTDDASAMELAGYQPLMVAGHHDNIKITRPEDLALAAHYLRQQEKLT